MKTYNPNNIDNVYISCENCCNFEFAPEEILELAIEPTKEKKWEIFKANSKEKIPHVKSGIFKIKIIDKSKNKLGIYGEYRHYDMKQIAKRLGGFCDVCRIAIKMKDGAEDYYWIPYEESDEEHNEVERCSSARFENGILEIRMGDLSEIKSGMRCKQGLHSRTPLSQINKAFQKEK